MMVDQTTQCRRLYNPGSEPPLFFNSSSQSTPEAAVVLSSGMDDFGTRSTQLPELELLVSYKRARRGFNQVLRALSPPFTSGAMTTNIFTPGFILNHPNDFLGPQIASVIIQGVELGIIGNQVIHYYSSMFSSGKKESTYVKWTVPITLVIMMFQTCMVFRRTYIMTVFEFGNWVKIIGDDWMFRIDPLLMGFTAAPVQAFFIRRCWLLFGKRWYILVPLVLLLIGNLITLILSIHYVFTFNRIKFILEPPKHLPYFFVLFYAFAACLDVSVTSIMIFYLVRVRKQSLSRSTNEMIRRLMISIWEAALPPAVCALVAMVVYLTRSSHDYWTVFLQGILGKLYVISLFAVLNARDYIKGSSFETGITLEGASGSQESSSVPSPISPKGKKNPILSSINFAWTRSTAPDVRISMVSELDSEKGVSSVNSRTDSQVAKGEDVV